MLAESPLAEVHLLNCRQSLKTTGGRRLVVVTMTGSCSSSIQETDDPMRAWTIGTDSNEHELVIGTSQMLKMKFACISREGH